MFSVESLTALTIGFYLAASVVGIVGLVWRRQLWRRAGCALAVASFCCQTVILIFGFHRLMPDGLSMGAYYQLLAWFSLLCGLGAWLRLRQESILLFAAPFGLLLFLLSAPGLATPINIPPTLSSSFYTLHIGALFLSLGLLAIACIGAALFLFLEKRIKARKAMRGMWADMPALSLLDRVNSVCALTAFPLYTIGLAAGFVWAKPVFGTTLSGDPKEIVSLVVWVLLAVLFHGRLALGWQGRKPARITVLVFLISLFSFSFVNLMLSGHHGYTRG